MEKAKCPSCSMKIELGLKFYVGKLIICPDCDAELKVIGKHPPLLDWAYEDSYDDYDEEDYPVKTASKKDSGKPDR